MGKSIFITYKYGDGTVRAMPGIQNTTVRDYVDKLQGLLKKEDHINKGELDGQDLSAFKDSTIASILRDKIFSSSVTIIMISPRMKDPAKLESDQWIPWEVSYSLKEHTREGRTSQTNAMLAIVLPDKNGSHEYFLRPEPTCNAVIVQTETLFKIISENMFNLKVKHFHQCNGNAVHDDPEPSYIKWVKWDDFVRNIDGWIDPTVAINERIADYKIYKMVD